MEELHRAYAGRGVQSVFLYVREAHPGEHYGPHDTFERKLQHAREFKRLFEVERPILVDDLEGTAHSAFGQMPNMTYILNSGHKVVFRSAWTDAPTVRVALEYLLDVQARRRDGARLAPSYSELQGFRWVDDAGFQAGLARNGPRAVTEFADAMKRWARGEHVGRMRSGDTKPT